MSGNDNGGFNHERVKITCNTIPFATKTRFTEVCLYCQSLLWTAPRMPLMNSLNIVVVLHAHWCLFLAVAKSLQSVSLILLN